MTAALRSSSARRTGRAGLSRSSLGVVIGAALRLKYARPYCKCGVAWGTAGAVKSMTSSVRAPTNRPTLWLLRSNCWPVIVAYCCSVPEHAFFCLGPSNADRFNGRAGNDSTTAWRARMKTLLIRAGLMTLTWTCTIGTVMAQCIPSASPSDGLNDEVAIQACLNQGGTVLLERGSPGYLIAGTLNITQSGTVFDVDRTRQGGALGVSEPQRSDSVGEESEFERLHHQ